MTDQITRRNFLFFGGAAVAGVTLGQVARRQLSWADARAAGRAAGQETWALSVCRECPAGCGVRVRLIDDQPVKLEGNPLCPISRGRLCAKGQASIESRVDPDRLTGPARRVGPHGSGAWERLSWDDATAMLAGRIAAAADEPGAILAVGAFETSPVADVWARVWRAGGARTHTTSQAGGSWLADRLAALTGVAADPFFDWERATHVLSFGAPLVEDWLSPVWAQRSFGRFRRFNGRPRGRLVQIEGRRSMTARKADEWLAVSADRQAALIYGIASVLLRENRIDRAALAPYLSKSSDFERVVTTRFTPNEVAAATGVPVVTILRLARDLVSAERPLVVMNADASRDLVDAVLVLNVFLGAFDRPGGIYAASPPIYAPSHTAEQFVDNGRPPSVILLRDSAEFRSLSMSPALESALGTAELVVSFSPFLDEAASVADLVLPAHTSLEAWHAVVPAVGPPNQLMAMAGPAAAPLVDSRDLVQTLKAVADAVGGPMAEACPWSSTEELVREQLTRIAALRRGGPYTSVYETEWMNQLERGGWWTPAADSTEGIAEAIMRAGGWGDPFFEGGRIRRSVSELGGCSLPAPPVLPSAPLLPAQVDALQPLRLEAFVPVVVNRLGSPNLPVLFELLGQPEGQPWHPWVEISPETAEMAGVGQGDWARVESASGSVKAVVVVVEGMQPGVAALAFVPAVPAGGRWARQITGDVRALARQDAIAAGTVAVRIVKA